MSLPPHLSTPEAKAIHLYYKTDVIRHLRTSLKTFNSLGIIPHDIEDNPHRTNGKAYVYTGVQVRDAAKRLGRWDVFVRFGGDPSQIPSHAGEPLGLGMSQSKGELDV